MTLLGDSYSAGTGAGDYYDEEDSYRSRNNWAHQYVRRLTDQGVPARLKSFAFNGDATDDVLGTEDSEGQVSELPTDTDLVMLTIDARLPDGAQVVLVGCPRLATDQDYVLESVNPFDPTTDDAGTNVRALSDSARQVQSELVSEWQGQGRRARAGGRRSQRPGRTLRLDPGALRSQGEGHHRDRRRRLLRRQR